MCLLTLKAPTVRTRLEPSNKHRQIDSWGLSK